MAKVLEPQLDEKDLDLIEESRLDLMAYRAVPITFKSFIVSGADEFTDTPIKTMTTVTLSGTVHVVTERDRLLQLGGTIAAGDLKVILYHRDVVAVSGLTFEAIRGSIVEPAGAMGGGKEYLVDVVDERGIGRPNRVECGLVLA